MALSTLSIVLLCLGALIGFIGGIMLLIAAFRESVVWGLVVLFAPLGNLIYTGMHWAEARAGFLTSLVGTVILAAGFCTLPNLQAEVVKVLKQQYPDLPIPGEAGKPKPVDLNAQIAEKRKALEDLQAAFAAAGRDLPAQYQQLEQRRKNLKAGDEAAIKKFNEDAAAYQAQNKRLKEMQAQIVGAQAAVDQLLDARSRAAVGGRPAADGRPAATKQVVMYTTSTCPACKMAKQYMAQKGIPYQEIDVQSSPTGREAFRKLGGNGVPLIMVGDKRMEGFNSQELERMLAAG